MNKLKLKTPETPVRPVPVPGACIHHWKIESPQGALSRGICKRCGEEKEFPNSAEDYLWERDVPQSRWTGRTELNQSEGY
ncbi:MAG: hypothetical protein WEC75_01250 [Dehalococcoidia bacterium]